MLQKLDKEISSSFANKLPSAVSKEDKAVIRSRLVDCALNEYDARLALQDALVIAKIARFEFPNDWPDAVSSVLDRLRTGVQAGNALVVARALLVLLHTTKELSTGRLQRTKQNLQSATPELIQVVGSLYATKIRNLLERTDATAGAHGDLENELHQSLLAIKLTRRLLISGYEHPNRDQDVVAFWQLTIQNLAALLQRVKDSSIPLTTQALFEKHMLQLAKLHREMARDHPAAFALLPDSIDLVRAYWGMIKDFGETLGSSHSVKSAVASATIGTDGDANDRSAMEKFVLRGMLVIRACVKMVHSRMQTFKYRQPQDKEERNQAIEVMRQQLLSESFVREVMETIVTRYFVFRASDLREWEEEPEEWEKREEGDGEDWEFSIRPCSEKLFLDLAINYKDMLVQPLMAVFHSVGNLENEDVLFKDSVYTAIGISAPILVDCLDFDAFIKNVLVMEVQKPNPGFNIIRRRAAILLGAWITVGIGESTKPLVYQIFQHLLTKDSQPLNDQVVRVTAGRQFNIVVDDWEFNPERFMPYAESVLTSLMHLIQEVELTETKMALLNTISAIVARLEHHISPFAERIVGLLPSLWEQSGEEHLMKQAVLAILSRLVTSMKAASLPFHSLVIPIIKGAVEPGSETQVYLLDDAMDLWANLLVQTPSAAPSTDLLDLSQYLISIFELGSENLRKGLEIAESYVLLAPSHMLSDSMRHQTFASLASLVGSLKPDANGLVCNLVEMVIRAAEKLGGEDAVRQTTADLVHAGFMSKLLEGLHGSWSAHCTTGPLAKEPPVDGIVETDYFSILARLALGSTNGFCQAVDAATPTTNGGDSSRLETTMRWLLEEWFSHFENIGDPSRRKLMCLALTKLLETNQPWVLLSLQSLMTVWTDVVRELCEGSEDLSGDCLVQSGPEPGPDGPQAPEDDRRRELTFSDPVHTVHMPSWIRHYLRQAMDAQPSFQQEWLANVDQDVLKAFGALGLP